MVNPVTCIRELRF